MALKPTETGQHPVAPKPPPKPAPKPAPPPPPKPPVVPGLGRALTPQEAQYITAQWNVAHAPPGPGNIPLDATSLIAQLPPDVQKIFNDAIAAAQAGQPLAPEALQGQLMQTTWFRTHSDSEKNLLWATITNPAEVQQEMNATALTVIQAAHTMGLHVSLGTLANITHRYIAENWAADPNRLTYELSRLPNLPGQGYGPGDILTAENAVHQTAQDYGINISNQAATKWGQDIVGGLTNQKAFEDYAKYQGMLNHPYWATQIENGATVRQLSDPWVQQAAQTLEIAPESINLTNPKWQFTTKDAHGNQTPMSVAQWNVHLMQDPQYGWDKTQNARQAAFGIVDQIQQAFGAK